MIERESEFLAVAHRKMDRVIVFHRLVTKTTLRRHKNWFSSRITSGEIPRQSEGRKIDRNLWVVTATTEISPFLQTKTTYQQNFYIIEIFG